MSSGESVPDRLAVQQMSHEKFCGVNRQKFLEDGCLPLAQNRHEEASLEQLVYFLITSSSQAMDVFSLSSN